MEQLTQNEQYKEGDSVERVANVQDTSFEQGGGALLAESKEAYENDLMHIEVALAHKRAALGELEQTATAHASVEVDAFAVLQNDLAGKIKKAHSDIELLETLNRVTKQRLALLIKEKADEIAE
ncbi:MAG: hypothetical protein UT41_C0001G0395 [Candidatus Wolfebacteria bacterium GW2011_GWC2_39_22]|uniref:Uncharacterized protein n=1 Tax=Candidatus Wolfebacteria bacterium GW2011_GWC2_39_22 TaxID=1619013 RepID=A0A0G0NJ33_9BACT|nr:MAG: hypothetical protein UT41_C0001G0395 [Candidatus Wolfebacteria bacterium GW2011_GWC2_39_22]HBI25487.1 hypothetical protein [Candidatus Wolfebacteria bacterium]